MTPSTIHGAAVLAALATTFAGLPSAAAQDLGGSVQVKPLGVGVYWTPDNYLLGVGGHRPIRLLDAQGRPLRPFPGAPDQWDAYDVGRGEFVVNNCPPFCLRKGDQVDAWYWSTDGRYVGGPFVVRTINEDGSAYAAKP